MAGGGENRTGPLAGTRIIEMAGIGPVPLAGLMLAELGAEVLRIERLHAERAFLRLPPEFDLDRHGRSILRADLKRPEAIDCVLDLCRGADVLIEGFRPGVMERLGLGPEPCHDANPALVYGRMTGFGQTGPLSSRAGHDLTYLAMTGSLNAIGPRDGKPVPPLNLVADYGGGTMFLLTGIMAALLERKTSGLGQVVDVAMMDGAAMLAAPYFSFLASGFWREERGANLLDSGAPFYDTYETADAGFMAVACLEPQFFAEFARLLPLEERLAAHQYDRDGWPEMRKAISERLRQKTRDEWMDHFSDSDACVAPVLSWSEAPSHPHNAAREAFANRNGMTRPGPAPRFSRTPQNIASMAATSVDDVQAAMVRFGIESERCSSLFKAGIVAGLEK